MTVATFGEPAGGPGLFQARVMEIWIEPTGDVLIASAGIGANVLTLNDVSDFSDGGGTLSVNGLVYSYISRDINADTLTLSTTLTAAVTDGDKVYLFPFSNERWGHCQIETGQDMVKARVPHGLGPLFFPGIRRPEDRESVYLAQEGTTWVVQNIVGKQPVVGGVTFASAEEGNRIEIVDDEHAGDLRFYTGNPNELDPGTIGTDVVSNVGFLQIFGPAMHVFGVPSISMYSNTSGANGISFECGSEVSINSPKLLAFEVDADSVKIGSGLSLLGFNYGLWLGGGPDGAGHITWAHGMGMVPRFVQAWPSHASRNIKINVNATVVDATNVQITVRDINTDALVTSGTIDFYWIVIA